MKKGPASNPEIETAEQYLDNLFPAWREYMVLRKEGDEIPRTNLRGLPPKGGSVVLQAGTTGYISTLLHRQFDSGPCNGYFEIMQPIEATVVGARGSVKAVFKGFHFYVAAMPKE